MARWTTQDSFGEMNDFPLTGTNRVFRVNKVKYQSIFANNCGYLALLHLYTHDAVDPANPPEVVRGSFASPGAQRAPLL